MIHIQGSFSDSDMEMEAWIRKAGQAAIDHLDAGLPVEITVALVGDEEIQRLNKQFLGIDAPTDVLSFPADELDPDTDSRYRGDVVVSVPTARRQAAVGGHSVEAEVSLLTVHGVLHLFGFDHADPDQKREMWRVQSTILQQIGNAITEPGENDLKGTGRNG
jgi:probable rRNA maturation factor